MKKFLRNFSMFLSAIITIQSAIFSISWTGTGFNAYAIQNDDNVSINLQSNSDNIPNVEVSVTDAVYGSINIETDIIPPTTPENLRSDGISHNEVTLYWNDSADDQGVKGYILYRDNKELTVVDSVYYKDVDLEASTKYTYSVAAFDYSNNVSEKSAPITVITSSVGRIGNGVGLRGQYYNDDRLIDEKYERLDGTIDFGWQHESPAPGVNGEEFSIIWTGQIEPLFSEEYTIYIEAHGGAKLWINGELLIDDWEAHNQIHEKATKFLEAGNRYDIKIQYREINGVSRIQLLWSSASQNMEVVPRSQLYPVGVPKNISSIATENSISISWDDVTFADSYDIEVDGNIVNNIEQNEYFHENLDEGTLHTYRIRANNGSLAGEWTDLINKWTLPGIPDGIQATSTSTSNTLTWNEVRGATGYDIEIHGNPVDVGPVPTYTDTDINANTQRTYRIRAKNSSGFGKWTDIIAKTTLPDVPKNLKGTATDSTVTVAWDLVAGADEYEIEIDGQLITTVIETSYVHEYLKSNSDHTYRVRAKNTEGASNWTDVLVITTLPSIPTNLQATVINEGIKVTWNAVDGATGYDIEVDGRIIDNYTDTTFMHNGLEENSEHTYRVRAKNGDITGAWTEIITRTTLVGVPTNIRANSTSTEITVMWDMVAGALGYDIEVDGIILDNGLNTTFVHKNLMPNTEHFYRVRTRNAGGLGQWSDYLKVTTIFGVPNNIVAVPTSDSVTLHWNVVDGATSYDVFVDGEVVSVIDGTTYVHSSLEPFSWHVYRVRARSGSFTGEWSETLTIATLLGTPSNISGVAESNSITVTWDAVIGATAYEIEADGKVIELGQAQRFIHENLLPNTLHTYRVRAKNENVVSEWSGLSDWSTVLPIMTPPDIPTNLRASATTNEIKLTWDSVENATEYDIEVDGKVVSNLKQNSYTNSKLEPNTRHRYRVRAKNEGGVSGWTEFLDQNTVPEITINVEKDNMFNFVIIAPKKDNLETREIVVAYDPEKLEVLDLCAETPEINLEEGSVLGTNIRVTNYKPGEITYAVSNGNKTTVNTIKFIVKTNEYSKVTYIIK